MKPIHALLAALLVVSSHAVSAAGLASEILAGKLLDASGVKEGLQDAFFNTIKPLFDNLRKNGGKEDMIKEMTDVAKKFYDDNYKWEDMRPAIVKAYAAELSDDDMKAILAFYETPAGKIAATKLPKLTFRGYEAVVISLQSKMPALQAAMVEVAKKYRDTKAK